VGHFIADITGIVAFITATFPQGNIHTSSTISFAFNDNAKVMDYMDVLRDLNK
jgi:hypothetical protein